MKSCSLVIVCAVLAAGTVTMSAQAQEAEPTVIAIADVQRLLRESTAGASLERQLTELRSSLAAVVAEREQALRQQEQELQEQSAILAPETFAERRRAFEEEVIEFQRDVRERQRTLDEAYGEGLDQIRVAIIEILQQMVEERGYDLILPQAQILVGSRELDITNDVLSELDQRVPTITISVEEN
ncbi:MAG: OmpH family outer membrane protein [Pseudomonadota bacterium]